MTTRAAIAALALACHAQPPVATPDAGSVTSDKEDWQRMKDCAEQADRMVKQLKGSRAGTGLSAMDWDNHYSPRYRRCYVRVESMSKGTAVDRGVAPMFITEVFDAFEGRPLAECTREL